MFVEGQIYRRRSLHEQYGGQQQGGISTPKDFPIILLITGNTGALYGYADELNEDGLFLYTGEGQIGDMQFIRGNKAIRDHLENSVDLHLFRDLENGSLRYIGQMICTGTRFGQAPDRNKNLRKTIVFELAPFSLVTDRADAPTQSTLSSGPKFIDDLLDLRQKAVATSAQSRTAKERKTNVYLRSEAIRLYALRRSLGSCEGCEHPAPFRTPDGNPYLEVHHIHRLSDGGPDKPDAVAALCPNCHRKAHYSSDAKEFNANLTIKVIAIESIITDP